MQGLRYGDRHSQDAGWSARTESARLRPSLHSERWLAWLEGSYCLFLFLDGQRVYPASLFCFNSRIPDLSSGAVLEVAQAS
jgi:hypothetical protein